MHSPPAPRLPKVKLRKDLRRALHAGAPWIFRHALGDVPELAEGALVLVRSIDSPSVFSAKFLVRARFVACIGAESEEVGRRLSVAFRERDVDSIRSLRLAPEAPDDSAWFVGQNSWFSTRLAAKRPSSPP